MKKKIPFKEDKQEKNFCQMLQQIVVLSTNVIKFLYLFYSNLSSSII